MPRSVDYYFSIVSPWSYLGHDAFEEIALKHGAGIVYKPVNLGEVFGETGGLPLGKRHPARQRYRLVEMQRWREKRGLPLKLHPAGWPFAPALGDQTVIAILDNGQSPSAFMKAAFRAIWDGEQNLAEAAALRPLLSAAGYDADAILARAGADETAATYAGNRESAIAAGVFGAPSYVLDGEVFWGQDRLDFLDAALSSGRAAYRSDA